MNKVNKVGKAVLILLLLTILVSTASAALLSASFNVEGTTSQSATAASHNGATSGVAPVKFWFVDNSNGDNLAGTPCSFNFGDSNVNTSALLHGEVNHTYTVPGTYTVNDTVTNGTGNVSLASLQVTVLAQNTAPIASFMVLGAGLAGQGIYTVGLTSHTAPASFYFQDTSTGDSITSYVWNFGDPSGTGNTQTSGTSISTQHRYNTAGIYNVTETVTNSIGNISIYSAQITVTPAQNTVPILFFDAIPMTGASPLAVTFEDDSNKNGTYTYYDGTINDGNCFWDFGDGSAHQPFISIPNSTQHVYNTPGNYIATLSDTFLSDNGTKVTMTKTQTINVVNTVSSNAIPDFTSNVQTGTSPLTVQFTNTSTFNGVNIASLSWNFGDPSSATNTATGNNPSHTYNNIGIYTVSLTATGTYANSSVYSQTTTKPAYINVTSVTPVNNNVVSFVIFPSVTGNAPFLVYFNATASTGSISKLHWDFGDGNTIDSTNKDSTVVDYYTAANTYPVNLTVTYSDLSTKSLIQNVNVTNNAITKLVKADFTANPMTGTHPLTVKFTDNSTNVNAWFWNFGDGSSSNQTNPSHVYTEIGTYKASLIVFNLSLYNDSLPPEKRLDPIIDSKQVTITVNDVEGNETNETNNTNTTQNNGVVVSHFESNATALIINDFVTTPTSGTVPLHTNSVSNITHLYPIKCWKWDFEPVGCDQYSQHPETAVHTFTHVGLFDLRLTVIDCKGNVAIMQKTNYVNVTAPVVTENNTCHPKPSSSCTPAKPSSSCSPAKPKTSCSTSSQFKLKGHQNCKVNIKCSTKTKVDGCTVNYGDGKGTHCLTSTHTYTKCGTYTVTVTAKNSSGCTVKKVVGTVTID